LQPAIIAGGTATTQLRHGQKKRHGCRRVATSKKGPCKQAVFGGEEAFSERKHEASNNLSGLCEKCMYSGLFEYKTPQKSDFYYSRGKKYGYSSEL